MVPQGSYCQCHYCKCEKGQVHCKGHGHKSGGYGGPIKRLKAKHPFQARSTAMEVWRVSTATVTTVSASMASARRATGAARATGSEVKIKAATVEIKPA